MQATEAAVLHKLIQLDTRCRDVLDQILHLASEPSTCSQVLEAHELYSSSLSVREGNGNNGDNVAERPDTELARLIEAEPALRSVFCQLPNLSEVAPGVLAVLASFADVRPDARGIPITRDGPFSYIATMVANEAGTTTDARLQQEFVLRLVDLNTKLPELVSGLRETCKSYGYRHAVNELDGWLNKLASGMDVPSEPPADLRRLVSACEPALARPADRGVLYESPRISQIPMEFVRSFPQEEPADRGRDANSGVAALFEQARRTGDIFKEIFASGKGDPERAVQLRREAALDLLERRKFVKTQMLEFGWPQLLDRVRAPGGERRLRDLELAVLETDPERQPDLTDFWKELLADERLVDFLRIPPYFRDISSTELADLAAAPGKPPVADGALAPANGSEEQALIQYTDVTLTLNLAHENSSTPNCVDIGAKLEVTGEEDVNAVMSLPIGEVREMIEMLLPAYLRRPPQAQEGFSGRDVLAISDAFPSPDEILDRIGLALWRSITTAPPIRDRLDEILARENYVRLILNSPESELADIPWECLHLPTRRTFAGLTSKLSVIRNIQEPVKLAPRAITRTLRILAVSSLPSDLPWVNAEQEVTLLKRTLEPAERAGVVRLGVLVNPTEEVLRSELRVFKPHIFHFVGHGAVQPDGQGVLALTDENQGAHLVTASQVGIMLQDYKILAAVLNACFTGAATNQDLAQGVAQVLVQQGVPAAVATTRPVIDYTALQFAREFYRALVDGYPLEGAVAEARKSIKLKDWDWSAYVVYASSTFPLHELRIPFRVS